MEKTVGMRIRECRVKLGMTQEELAEALYIRKNTVSYYENDKVDIKVSALCELAKVLGTSMAYLLGEETRIMSDEIMHAVRLLQKIKSDALRKMAIEQLKIIEATDRELC